MVTSHLGRPTEGEWKRGRFAGADRAAAVRAARHGRCRSCATGSTAARGSTRCSRARSCCSRTAASTRARRRTTTTLARKMAKLCDVYVNDAFGTAHRAEATTHGIAKHAPVACAGPLLAAELDALGTRARARRAAAGRHRRRLEGVDQAHDPARARREGRRADRRRRHRQHVHPGRGRQHRQVARRARARRRGARRSSTSSRARCRSRSTRWSRKEFKADARRRR